MPNTRPRIYMQEVATRDGFQNESQFIETEDKVRVIDALSLCGFAKIEVTSFTSPKAIPALRDAERVMHEITRQPGVEYTVLVPNVRGAERALSCGIDEANLVMSMSETHNRSNLRMTREQSFAQLEQVVSAISGSSVAINISLSTSFGCPMEGDVSEDEVLRWIERFANLGVTRATLCDTTGMAYPSQVRSLSARAKALFPEWYLPCTFTTRDQWLRRTHLPRSVRGSIALMLLWVESEDAPMHRAQVVTPARKTWYICWNWKALTPTSIWSGC